MKKNRNKYIYTLVELLMAMAIFAIISVIMMRFFSSAQQIWSKASQKNALYSDARVALDIMASELQAAMYDNKPGSGIYPFWYEYKSLKDPDFTSPLYDYTNVNETGRYDKNYVPQLNFIAATAYPPNSYAKSNVCEIKYLFLPARYDANVIDKPTGEWIIGGKAFKGGTLVRACTGDRDSLNNSNVTAGLYNFQLLPNGSSGTRVDDIFIITSSEQYQEVISGIIDMEVTCYTMKLNAGLYELRSYNPMKNDGIIATNAVDRLRINGDLVNAADIGSLASGTPFPVMLKIDLYMLAERDLREWLTVLNDFKYSAAARINMADKIKRERLRCFSKIIYLSSGK